MRILKSLTDFATRSPKLSIPLITAVLLLPIVILILALDGGATDSLPGNLASELIGLGLGSVITVLIVDRVLAAHERGRWKQPRLNFMRSLGQFTVTPMFILREMFDRIDAVIHGVDEPRHKACDSFRSELDALPQRELPADTCSELVKIVCEKYHSWLVWAEPLFALMSDNRTMVDDDPELYNQYQELLAGLREWKIGVLNAERATTDSPEIKWSICAKLGGLEAPRKMHSTLAAILSVAGLIWALTSLSQAIR